MKDDICVNRYQAKIEIDTDVSLSFHADDDTFNAFIFANYSLLQLTATLWLINICSNDLCDLSNFYKISFG